MAGGWIVAVIVNNPAGRGTTRQLWDCAIPNFHEAERAVAKTIGWQHVNMIGATDRLSEQIVRTLGLADNEVRKRQYPDNNICAITDGENAPEPD